MNHHTIPNTALIEGIRRIHDGCLYCGQPATMLIPPSPGPWSGYDWICEDHLHGDEGTRHNVIPLIDILTALGVKEAP